jgi:hypothetical protein
MGQLAFNHLGHAALLDHDHDRVFSDLNGTAIKVDELRGVEAERTKFDTIFVDCGSIPLDLLDERDERASKSDHVWQAMAAKDTGAHLEEVFCRRIHVFDGEALAHDQERMRERFHKRFTRQTPSVSCRPLRFG